MALPTSGALTLDNIQTEFGGTNPIGLNEYYAGGGLVPAGTSGTYGAVPSSGALSVQNFYGTTAFTPIYIEDVFSTYLYTGNGSTQTITNGIDLAGKGGLVWVKGRNETYYHRLASSPGPTLPNYLASNATDAASSGNGTISAFSSSGFTANVNGGTGGTNSSGINYVSWTFRKQPKFFDVVTYTGDGNNNRLISHNLGSTPGCVIVKCTSHADTWAVWHRSLTSTQYSMALNTTAAQGNAQANQSFSFDGSVSMSSTQFVVSQEAGYANSSDKTYVAYLFAHNAGGFGPTGTDNVISCGSMDGATGTTVTLGYEPQFVMYKAATTTGNWVIVDNMRGMTTDGADQTLTANTANAEGGPTTILAPNATGFSVKSNLTSGQTYIYIAIRRGPMKVPTSGTSVFSPIARTGTGATATVTGVGFPPDLFIVKGRSTGTEGVTRDRLRGTNPASRTATNNAESSTTTNGLLSYDMSGVTLGADNTGTDVNGQTNASPYTYANWFFGRAPSFFDEVCYTGTGSNRTVTHNLGVAPEMVIYRRRDTTANWIIYCLYNTAASSNPASNYLNFDASLSSLVTTYYDAPTSSVLNLKSGATNTSGGTYVAYLFATCAGVSKVGSYTGTGTTQQINCGFTSGARFVLIKRTDASLSAWYVWDSARGIVAGNDPYLLLNSTATEVTSTDYIDTYSAGFEISSTAPAAINASGGKFIFLAIA